MLFAWRQIYDWCQSFSDGVQHFKYLLLKFFCIFWQWCSSDTYEFQTALQHTIRPVKSQRNALLQKLHLCWCYIKKEVWELCIDNEYRTPEYQQPVVNKNSEFCFESIGSRMTEEAMTAGREAVKGAPMCNERRHFRK